MSRRPTLTPRVPGEKQESSQPKAEEAGAASAESAQVPGEPATTTETAELPVGDTATEPNAEGTGSEASATDNPDDTENTNAGSPVVSLEGNELYQDQMGSIEDAAKGLLIPRATEIWPALDTPALRAVVALRTAYDELVGSPQGWQDKVLSALEVHARVRAMKANGGIPHISEVDPAKIERSVLTSHGYVIPTPKPGKADI